MATTHLSRGTGSSVSFMESLETRRLLASIAGAVWNDVNSSKTYDNGEPLLAGWTVYLDANKNRQFDADEVSTVSDAKGAYKFDGLAAGTYTVAEVLQPGYGQTFPGRAGVSQSNFKIDVIFKGDLTPTQQAVFSQAAAKWQSIIVGDLPDVMTDIGLVDDVAIDATGKTIDGVDGILGQAAPTQLRDSTFLPARGEMEFDTADLAALEADGSLYSVIVHEMGHVLGFGTIWGQTGNLVGRGAPDPKFVGAAATAEYNKIFGLNAAAVPVEAGGDPGTAYSHWPEESFGDELMTGYISGASQPLSRITAAQFQDLGYTVNLDGADPYSPFGAGVRSSAVKRPSSRVLDITPTILPASALVPSALITNLPYAHTITVTDKKNAPGLLFGNRVNADPTIGMLQASPADVVMGNNVTLRAMAVSDAENDGIYQVKFYRESNGIAGLQSGDTYIATDTNFLKGGWRVDAPTAGVVEGVTVFYARAYDELGGSSVKKAAARLFEPQPAPSAPSITVASALDSTSIRVSWTDNSNNETGFEVQRSTNPGFTGKLFKYAAEENVTTLDIKGLNPGGLYFYRVRAINTGGVSGFSSPASGRTQTTGEVIVDNAFNAASVLLKGAWAKDSATSGYFRNNYLQDGNSGKTKTKGKAAIYMLDVPVEGEYYVYGRWTRNTGNAAAVPYYITSSVEGEAKVVSVDQSTRGGGWVLLGTYEFGTKGENSVTISTQGTSGIVVADSIRLLPTTQTVDTLQAYYGTGGVTASSLEAPVPAVTSSASVSSDVLTTRDVYAGLRSKTFAEDRADLLD